MYAVSELVNHQSTYKTKFKFGAPTSRSSQLCLIEIVWMSNRRKLYFKIYKWLT